MPDEINKPYQRWEYRVVDFASQDQLNDLGKDWWEVVCVMEGVLGKDRFSVIFKKPLHGRPNA
jgi:hypothetical protein